MREDQEEMDLKVEAIYKHPQGKAITVFSDGSMLCIGPDGKKKSTSATPEKLAAGYGEWYRIDKSYLDEGA